MRQSGEGIVYSGIDVKKWEQAIPPVDAARPGRCSRCRAPSRPLGAAVVLVGHGLRLRQVRGPADAHGAPCIRTVWVRRYRCRLCGALTTVLPRGLTARRHYSASAIGLALCLYGLQRLSIRETRSRVCAWRHGFERERWSTLHAWVTAIEHGRLFKLVRPSPPTFSAQDRAERAAATLCSFAIAALPVQEQAFVGAALAA